MSVPPTVESVELVVRGASRSLGRLLDSDPEARTVLEDLDTRPAVGIESVETLVRWKRHEFLRIAARDLLGIGTFDAVAAALATMAADVFDGAIRLAGADDLAVIGMGKLGGRELNYSSDVDVMLVVGIDADLAHMERAARVAIDIARRCFRVDLNLRPEGRNGALVRTLPSYEAYWQRWAQAWEFQALLKARAVAGDAATGTTFVTAASRRVWERPFTADDLRAVRSMKARAEHATSRRGVAEREVKLGRGGIR